VILLDTNVMSELMRPVCDSVVLRWFLLNEDDCCLSSVAIGELAYGTAKLDIGQRRQRLETQVSEWRIRFQSRILVHTDTTAMIYGELMAQQRRQGRPMSIPDGQIAASAIEHDAVLATRNLRDFEGVSLKLVDPWMG
jgi:toxin FitB